MAGADGGCKGAVSKAIGREITDAEMAKVRGEIDSTLRMLWRVEPETMRGLSKADQFRHAAARAADNLKAQAALKQKRLALSIQRNAENMAYLDSRGMTFAAFNNLTSFGASLADGGPGRLSVESQARATAEMAKAELVDLAEASGGKFFGFVESPEQVRGFMRALWGAKDVDPAMAKAAASWKKVTDGLRDRFNRAGGDIGNLGDLWHLPQVHDAYRIAKAGADAWIKTVLPKLDRRQYVTVDGSRMSDAEIREFLRESWTSIATDGANKMSVTGGPKGKGSRANRHGESRALFFKDADSYMDYQLQFGGENIYGVLFGHIDTLAKDIALLETFGPNAEANARLLLEEIYHRQALSGGTAVAEGVVQAQKWRANAIFEDVAGIGQGPAAAGWAGRMAAARSWMTATRLGSAVLSSITDHATIIQTARMWDLPTMQFYRNYWKAMNPANVDERRFLQRQGLAIQVFAASMDRFSGEYGGMRTHKIANAVMRASGLTAITDARRRAFSATMMSALGHLAKNKAWDQLDATDLKLLKAKGITPEVYGIWQKAKLQTSPDFEGGLLSGRAIMEISDDDIAAAIKDRVDSLTGQTRAEAQAVMQKAQEMQQRVLDRQNRHAEYVDKLTKSLDDYKARRDQMQAEVKQKAAARVEELRARRGAASAEAAELGTAKLDEFKVRLEEQQATFAERAAARQELLQAQIEKASVESDIDTYLRAAKDIEAQRRLLEQVEEGASAEHLAPTSKRRIEDLAKFQGKQGETLGARRERTNRMIRDLEKKVSSLEKANDQRIADREKYYTDRLAQLEKSADKDAAALEARQARRQRDLERTAQKEIKAKEAELTNRAYKSLFDYADYSKKMSGYVESYLQQAQRIEASIGKRRDALIQSMRQKAASQLMALVLEEQNMAVIEAGARERSLLYAGTRKGTLGGELMRAVMQFKTFPFAMLTRHWGRAMSMPTTGGRAGQMASLFVLSTITGAMALEIKALADGKDPRALWESDDPVRMSKTWVAAAMQGGALGIFGDFLTSTANRGGSDFMSTMAGPIPGMVGDVANLGIGSMAKAAMGDDLEDVGADALADSVRIARGLVPGSSLWYAKAAFNNLVFGQLQELASPGYLDRMRRRVARETGQDYWWQPGEIMPERAPDLGAAAGE